MARHKTHLPCSGRPGEAGAAPEPHPHDGQGLQGQAASHAGAVCGYTIHMIK